MILSQKQIEEIAASTTKDFNRFFFGDEADKPDRPALPTPIDQFAKNYLGLQVSFARLSPDGSICGITAYADTEYALLIAAFLRMAAIAAYCYCGGWARAVRKMEAASRSQETSE